MNTLHIYTSEGDPLGDGPAAAGDRVAEYFFDGVRLYLVTGGEPELIVFFRARESEASRAEQYYAVYQPDTITGLFEQFAGDLRTAVEDDHGLLLATESDDTQVVAALTADQPVPGSDDQHSALSSLLAEQQQLRFAVQDERAALAVIKQYASSPAERFAIADDTTTDSLASCDLAVEPGGDSPLDPLGDTVELFDEQRRRTTANAARPRATSPAATDPDDRRDRLETIGKEVAAVVVGVVLFGLLLTLAINGAAMIGIELPGLDWVIFV